MPSPNETANHRAAPAILAGLRMYLGLVLLVAVWPKLFGDVRFASQLPMILERLGEGAHPAYRAFLHGVVIPHAGVFAVLVMAGEVVAGLALVTGTATRLGAAVASLLFINYMALKGTVPWAPSSNDAAFLVIAVALLLGAAGRSLGVDRVLAARWPKVPLW
jgi:uncharacterized membrane protein YphA (DoxX/SURF4 family)